MGSRSAGSSASNSKQSAECRSNRCSSEGLSATLSDGTVRWFRSQDPRALNRQLSLACLVWALVMVSAHVALAETVVFIMVPAEKSQDYGAYASRLHSELTAAGFAAVTTQSSSSLDPAMVAADAERFSSPISVSITISQGMVSGFVWIADLQKGGGTLRPVPEYPIGDDAPSVFAVKATDMLQGLLVELGYRAKRPDSHESEASPAEPTGKPPAPSQLLFTKSERAAKPPSGENRTVPKPALSALDNKSNAWQITAAVSVMERWPMYPGAFGGASDSCESGLL